MPDVQELFRSAVQNVQPDPGALQRQHNGQRRRTIKRKAKVYALVAALVAAVLLLGITAWPRGGGGPKVPAQQPTTSSSDLNLTPQHVVIVDLNGMELRDVSGFPSDRYGLSLSPDGRTIAFLHGMGRVSTVGIDGTGRRDLPVRLGIRTVVWSPDGSQLAFSRGQDGNTDIYVMNRDGSNVRRLTTSPAVDEWPSWSPDGSTIVYDNMGSSPPDSDGFSQTSELFTIPATGGEPTRITRNSVDDAMPDYSPDGTQIAYHHGPRIWVMDADGSNAHVVADIPCCSFTPQWSPDGSRIAFTTYDASWRARLSPTQPSAPIVRVLLLDPTTGRVYEVGDSEMATDDNSPQWLPSSDALLLNRLDHP